MKVNHVMTDIRNAEITTGSGTDVRDTKMLSGEAKSSLSGSNVTKQFTTSSSMSGNGPWGGENAGK